MIGALLAEEARASAALDGDTITVGPVLIGRESSEGLIWHYPNCPADCAGHLETE